jgi:hypothetical protein
MSADDPMAAGTSDQDERARTEPQPFVVCLPPINGQLYVGLSAVGDQRLSANKMLVFVDHAHHETSAMLGALALFKILANGPHGNFSQNSLQLSICCRVFQTGPGFEEIEC